MYTPQNGICKTSLIMDLIAERQKVLSANLANMDTPNYVRKDVEFSQYLGNMNSPLETQLSTKLGASGVIQEQQGPVNPVTELTEMQKNSTLYSVASRRMSVIITEMKTVVNVGK